MKKVISLLNCLRVTRVLLFVLLSLLFISVLLISYIFTNNEWLFVLISFNMCLLIVIFFILIEVNIGYKYHELYHNEFLSLLFKKLSYNYYYNVDNNRTNELIY